MDKNTLLGLFLIGLILFGFSWYTNSEQQNQQQQIVSEIQATTEEKPSTKLAEENLKDSSVSTVLHTIQESKESETTDTLRNDLFSIVFSSYGGRVASVELEEYKRLYEPYKGEKIKLFEKESSNFGIQLYLKSGKDVVKVNTSSLPFKVAEKTDSSIEYRYYADSIRYLAFKYSISTSSNYMVSYKADYSHIKDLLILSGDEAIMWDIKSPQQEKGFKNENNYTTISYKYVGTESIEELSPSTEREEKSEIAKINWLAFKQQFFSSIIIADDSFSGGTFSFDTHNPKDEYIKDYHAELNIPLKDEDNSFGCRFYFGPNKFAVMNQYSDLCLQKVIPLGGWIVGWISRLVVIPTFDFLSKYISSYGIIILLLTILIKLVISPLTYKSYLSTAKMRVLKPEMDKISEKYPKQEDAVKKQQAVMSLYKSAGVSPMGGCLPLLIQFPILWAMFRFFPTAIELRDQSFLWTSDLSSYDSIWTFPGGFEIPWYGDHISLFTLLMAVSMYVTSKINMATQPQNNSMPGMNFMMLYMMPIMLLIWFNDYASGLTYYYLLSNLFALAQTLAFRYLINDSKLHAQIEANKKKPQKKSKWAERLEKMQRQAEQQQRLQGKKK